MTAAADGLRKNRIPIMMSDAELKAIDDWRFERRIGSRGDAIRQLCEIGIEPLRTYPTDDDIGGSRPRYTDDW